MIDIRLGEQNGGSLSIRDHLFPEHASGATAGEESTRQGGAVLSRLGIRDGTVIINTKLEPSLRIDHVDAVFNVTPSEATMVLHCQLFALGTLLPIRLKARIFPNEVKVDLVTNAPQDPRILLGNLLDLEGFVVEPTDLQGRVQATFTLGWACCCVDGSFQ